METYRMVRYPQMWLVTRYRDGEYQSFEFKTHSDAAGFIKADHTPPQS